MFKIRDVTKYVNNANQETIYNLDSTSECISLCKNKIKEKHKLIKTLCSNSLGLIKFHPAHASRLRNLSPLAAKTSQWRITFSFRKSRKPFLIKGFRRTHNTTITQGKTPRRYTLITLSPFHYIWLGNNTYLQRRAGRVFVGQFLSKYV